MKKYEDSYSLKTPTLTIIIPAYNVEKYITETLDSIANQSSLPDEIIIINDGSTDDTSNKIKDHPLSQLINLVETENKGQGHARNIGIDEANCDYIYFFDSDDLLTKNFVKSIKEIAIDSELPDLILFSGKSFKDKNLSNSGFFPNYIRPFEGVYKNQHSFFKALIEAPELSCSPCLYISKRSIWSDSNLRFNYFFHEDEEIFYPLIFSSSSYAIFKDIFFLRRIRPNSTMTQSKSKKHELGQEAVLKSLLNLLNKNKKDNLKAKLIRRRLGIFCLPYLSTSRKVSNKLNYKLLLSAIIQSRSVKTPLKIIKQTVKLYAQKTQ